MSDRFLGYFGDYWDHIYKAKTAIFKIWVFWVKTMHSITLYAIDIHNNRCLEPFYHSMTTLNFGGFLFGTGSISWNLVLCESIGDSDPQN